MLIFGTLCALFDGQHVIFMNLSEKQKGIHHKETKRVSMASTLLDGIDLSEKFLPRFFLSSEVITRGPFFFFPSFLAKVFVYYFLLQK